MIDMNQTNWKTFTKGGWYSEMENANDKINWLLRKVNRDKFEIEKACFQELEFWRTKGLITYNDESSEWDWNKVTLMKMQIMKNKLASLAKFIFAGLAGYGSYCVLSHLIK